MVLEAAPQSLLPQEPPAHLVLKGLRPEDVLICQVLLVGGDSGLWVSAAETNLTMKEHS